MYLNIKLEEKEAESFIFARDKLGIKSNTDFVRYVLKQYILKKHGSCPNDGKFKIYSANDLCSIEDLGEDREAEISYRRGFHHGFLEGVSTKDDDVERKEDLIFEWRYKLSPSSFVPFDTFKGEK